MSQIETISIRETEVADHDPIHELVALAFNNEEERVLVEKLRTSGNVLYEIVAEMDGKIIGHVLFSPMYDRNGAKIEGTFGMAPVSVHPDYQGKGVGKSIIQESLAVLKDGPGSLVTVLGETKYYSKFGFQLAKPFGIQSPFPLTAPFMVLSLHEDFAAYAVDFLQFGPEFDGLS